MALGGHGKSLNCNLSPHPQSWDGTFEPRYQMTRQQNTVGLLIGHIAGASTISWVSWVRLIWAVNWNIPAGGTWKEEHSGYSRSTIWPR